MTKAFELRPSTEARLRLAHVFQWQGRFAEAHAEFARCAETSEIPDFVHQHWGKCYFDEGDPALAESSRTAVAAASKIVRGPR